MFKRGIRNLDHWTFWIVVFKIRDAHGWGEWVGCSPNFWFQRGVTAVKYLQLTQLQYNFWLQSPPPPLVCRSWTVEAEAKLRYPWDLCAMKFPCIVQVWQDTDKPYMSFLHWPVHRTDPVGLFASYTWEPCRSVMREGKESNVMQWWLPLLNPCEGPKCP